MIMPIPQDDSSPLMNQAFKGFFGLPWPRKPLGKSKPGQGGKSHGKSGGQRQPKLKRVASKLF
jgi:hypothetical protein